MKKWTALLLAICLLFSGLAIRGYAEESASPDTIESTQAYKSSSPSIESTPQKYIYVSPEEKVVSYSSGDDMHYEINITNSTPYDSLVVSYATTVNTALNDYRRDTHAYTKDGITLSVEFSLDENKFYDEILTDFHKIEFEEIRIYVRAFLDGEVVDGNDSVIYILPTVNGVFASIREAYYAYNQYLNDLLENELITEAQYNHYLRTIATLSTEVEYEDPKDADAAIEAKLAVLNSGNIALKHLPSTFELIDTPPTIQANKIIPSVFETSDESEPIISTIPKTNTRTDLPLTASRVRIDRTIIVSEPNIHIFGYVYWYDINGRLHPLRGANVTVWDEDALTNQNYGNVYSNDLGEFDFWITNDTSWLEGGLDIFLEINSYGNGFTVKKYNGSSTIYSNNFYFCTGVEYNVKSNYLSKTYISEKSESEERDRAFQIHQSLYTGYRYFRAMNTNNVKTVSAFYSYESDNPENDTSHSNSTGIYIIPDDCFSWDIVLHELGHQVESYLETIDPSWSGISHTYHENLADTHGKSIGIKGAWAEGWATYFAIASQLYFHNTLGITLANIPTANNTSRDSVYIYNYGNSVSHSIDVYADYTTYRGFGEANEAAVTAVLLNMLWDANVGKTDQQLWNIAKNSKSKTFDAFIDAFYSQNISMKIRSAVGFHLEKQRITNNISGKSVSETLAKPNSIYSKGVPPTLNWENAYTKTTAFPYTSTVVLWDKNYNQIATIGTVVGNGVDGISVSSSQWSSLVSAVGNDIFYWGIISTQTNSPSTGPYYTSLQKCVFSSNMTNITSTGTTPSYTLTANKENWYKITVPSSGNYTITASTTTNISVQGLLFKDSCLNDNNASATGTSVNSSYPIIITTTLSANTPVYLCIKGATSSVSGTYNITLTKTN